MTVRSGTHLFFNTCDKFSLNPKQNATQKEILIKSAMRFIISFITLPIITSFGIVFHFFLFSGYLAKYYYEGYFAHLSAQDKADLLLECQKHMLCFLYDATTNFFSIVISVGHTLIPGFTEGLDRKIYEYIEEDGALFSDSPLHSFFSLFKQAEYSSSQGMDQSSNMQPTESGVAINMGNQTLHISFQKNFLTES